MSNEVLAGIQVASVLTYVGIAVYLYRTVVASKDATIEALKTNITFLKDQLDAEKARAPEAVAELLEKRVARLTAELKRLEADRSTDAAEVARFREMLKLAREEAKKWEATSLNLTFMDSESNVISNAAQLRRQASGKGDA